MKSLNRSEVIDIKYRNNFVDSHGTNNTIHKFGASKNAMRAESPSPGKVNLNHTFTQMNCKTKPFLMPNTARRNKISIVNEVLDGEVSKVFSNSNESNLKTSKILIKLFFL
jgi:hypothetical protein